MRVELDLINFIAVTMTSLEPVVVSTNIHTGGWKQIRIRFLIIPGSEGAYPTVGLP